STPSPSNPLQARHPVLASHPALRSCSGRSAACEPAVRKRAASPLKGALAVARRRAPTFHLFESSPENRPYFQKFRKEREVESLLQKRHAGRTAGTAAIADDAFYRLHVAETPQLEVLFDVHQLFREVIFRPETRGVFVDALQHGDQFLVARVRL